MYLCILSLFVIKKAFLPTRSRNERNARVMGTYTKRNIASAIFHSTDIPDIYGMLFPFFFFCKTAHRQNISGTMFIAQLYVVSVQAMKAYVGGRCVAPLISNLGAGWSELCTSLPQKEPPSTPCQEVLVGPRDITDVSENRKIPCP